MAELSPIAQALGRIPSGLFILTTGLQGGIGVDAPTGMLASFVQQMGFEPPVLAAAVGRDRAALELLRRTGRFAVSVLDGESKGLLGHFARGFEPGEEAFNGVKIAHHDGLPYLPEALAWMACEVVGEADWTDHITVAGRVVAGARRGGASPSKGSVPDPMVHLRTNGLSY